MLPLSLSIPWNKFSDVMAKSWACRFSRAKCVLVAAGTPCQGRSGLAHDLEGGSPRMLLHEVSRLRDLVERHFVWAKTFVLIEGMSSMSDVDRANVSRGVGILPYELDAVGITPCRRSRLYWFNWKVCVEHGTEIETPLTPHAEDFGRISFLLDCCPDPYLSPGCSLAGGMDHKLPAFAFCQPKAQPGFQTVGMEKCSVRDLSYWETDNFRFPPVSI